MIGSRCYIIVWVNLFLLDGSDTFSIFSVWGRGKGRGVRGGKGVGVGLMENRGRGGGYPRRWGG